MTIGQKKNNVFLPGVVTILVLSVVLYCSCSVEPDGHFSFASC